MALFLWLTDKTLEWVLYDLDFRLEKLMTDAIEPVSGEAGATAPVNPDLRWYIVHAYSGMEKAVERNITERIKRAGMQDKFGRILVPYRRSGGDEERSAQNH